MRRCSRRGTWAGWRSLGVIASMQPTHATSDMPWAEERVGPLRIVGAYAWRQLRDSGARLALGSDFPVESVDPRLGLHSATTRTDGEGHPVGGWLPQEKLTAWEALRGFTRDAAWAGFAEDSRSAAWPPASAPTSSCSTATRWRSRPRTFQASRCLPPTSTAGQFSSASRLPDVLAVLPWEVRNGLAII
jgi:hypothetical protein